MATSGSFYSYPVKSFGLYCEWSAAQNPAGNYSDITLKTYLSYYTLNSSSSTAHSSINGTEVQFTMPSIYKMSASGWTKQLVHTQTVRVYHNSDGSKNGVQLYASWDFYGSYSGVSISIIKATATIDLDAIDRKPPTVSFSVSNITTHSLTISATSNTTCEEWYYSLDNGVTWTSYSKAIGTSASTTVNGLSVNTLYHIKVHARRTVNQVPGISSTVSAKTLGHAILNSCADFYADTETVTLSPNVTVYESSFTERLILKDGSTELFSINSLSWTAGTANRSITLTDAQKQALLKAMPKATLKLTLEVKTYSGSTLVGTTTCNAVAKTSAENSKPVWASPYISLEDTSDCRLVTKDSTIMIQGHSNLVVTAIGVTARNYATIADYTVTIGDKTVKSTSPVINVGKIEVYGELSLRLTVTDSRGHSHDLYRTVTVLKYEAPKITKIAIRRANGIDNVIQMSFTASMSTIKPDGNTDVNSLIVAAYYYRLTNETDYGDAIQFTDNVVRSSNGTTLSFETKELLSLDNRCSYDFVLQIQDRVTGQWTHHVIPKGIPDMAVRKGKVGINTPDPKYALDVVGDVNFSGRLLRNGIDILYPVGSIYMSTNATDPAQIFGGTWERLKDRFLLAAGDTYQAGATGGEAAHKLTTEEMPKHIHEENLRAYGYSGWNDYTTPGYGLAFSYAENKQYFATGHTFKSQQVGTFAQTSNAGGDAAHNNMPPYLAVYMWVRKA